MNSPLQSFITPWTYKAQVQLYLKREDFLHPEYGGNKIRKLKYIVEEALSQNKKGLLTCGGAYSNHIRATAVYSAERGLKSLALIRGEEVDNETLQVAQHHHMQLVFVPRDAYRALRENPSLAFELSGVDESEWYYIPEGGHHPLAVKGVAELVSEIDIPYHYLATACGTGTTFAGLMVGVQHYSHAAQLMGFPVLNKGEFLLEDIQSLLGETFTKDRIHYFSSEFALGGYAKTHTEYLTFLRDVEKETGVLFDPIYNGKMIWGLKALMERGFFPKGSTIVALHTGGQQGWAGK
ncbi:MAG: pyridoxal-phosphate dependent enzyme [Cytophagaceae bacterium]|jgi:1-aminocyclopropane-1-carboxylate deaminase|nr:pyridoxal-phosphate dependent enzyme [Cytophagaceae bacterium]